LRRLVDTGRCPVFAQLIDRPRHNRGLWKPRFEGRDLAGGLFGGLSCGFDFHIPSLLAKFMDLSPTLSEPLSLSLVYRLEALPVVPSALDQLVQRGTDEETFPAGLYIRRAERQLVRPGARRPLTLILAAGLEIGRDTLFPPTVLPMMPAVMCVNRIVAVTAGVEREPRHVAGAEIVGSVVIAEIVVVVTRSQEQMGDERG